LLHSLGATDGFVCGEGHRVAQHSLSALTPNSQEKENKCADHEKRIRQAVASELHEPLLRVRSRQFPVGIFQ
jgi:hypothetical protein